MQQRLAIKSQGVVVIRFIGAKGDARQSLRCWRKPRCNVEEHQQGFAGPPPGPHGGTLPDEQSQTEGHRRELFFWTAQSFYEVGDFALSAAYYLESARLAGERNPFWEKSALYQAAQALESASFYDDAANVYNRLLGSSPDPKMQAKLRYRLAQIEHQRKRDLSP